MSSITEESINASPPTHLGPLLAGRQKSNLHVSLNADVHISAKNGIVLLAFEKQSKSLLLTIIYFLIRLVKTNFVSFVIELVGIALGMLWVNLSLYNFAAQVN